MAVKTSTRERVNGRKRVSKPKNLINVPSTLKSLGKGTKSLSSSFFKSYQTVSIFMLSLAILVGLSSFGKAGPIGEFVNNLITWSFGYGVYLFPLLLIYGSAILIRDKDFIIDLSGSLEDVNGKKDINKINRLLNLFEKI